MNTVILTSALDMYDRKFDENGNKIRIPHRFGNINGILDLLKSKIKNYDNFLFVASDENGYERTNEYSKSVFASFELTLPFKHYAVLDGRTENNAKSLIEKADFIYLCGGHLPTQNQFFNKIGLRELIKNTDAIILGQSAGSMNCADVVFCPPELEGESLDKNFKRYFKGLGLTNINILPHYNFFQTSYLDGKKFIEEIVMPDTYKTDVIAINDGSYVLIEDNKATIFGEAYLIKNGKIKQICKNEQELTLKYKEKVMEKYARRNKVIWRCKEKFD